jgi:tRNA A37 methylthiotransferase MiaB
VPKTYNSRQIEHVRLEAACAPALPDIPDTSRYVRFFSPEEIAALVDRIMARVAAGQPTHLRPDTALLVAKALQARNATPQRQDIVREICGIKDGCKKQCLNCIGKANAIMGLYEGRAAR